jgi:hypothetical protein
VLKASLIGIINYGRTGRILSLPEDIKELDLNLPGIYRVLMFREVRGRRLANNGGNPINQLLLSTQSK